MNKKEEKFTEKYAFLVFIFALGFIGGFPGWIYLRLKYNNSKDKRKQSLANWSEYFLIMYGLIIGFLIMAVIVFTVTSPSTKIDI